MKIADITVKILPEFLLDDFIGKYLLRDERGFWGPFRLMKIKE
jgi:hypothetical protein